MVQRAERNDATWRGFGPLASVGRTLGVIDVQRREFDCGLLVRCEPVARERQGRVVRANRGRSVATSCAAVAIGLLLVVHALPAGAASSAAITIQGFVFTPEDVTIAPGDSVVWTNADFVAHNVSGGSFQSGNFATGTFTHTFTVPGTFSYICTLHSGMQGTITVTDAPDPVVPETPWPAMLSATAALVAAFVVLRPRTWAA
jgi:plastocyanin